MNSPVYKDADSLIESARSARSRGETALAIRILEEAVTQWSENPAIYFELGLSYYRKGDLEQATVAYLQALEYSPRHKSALVNLGVCYNEAGQNLLAIECYEKALAIDPATGTAWGNLAKAWHDNNEHETSIYCYLKALHYNRSTQTLRGLALAYRKCRRYDRSEALLKEVLERNPDDARAHFGLAMGYLYQEDYKQALPHFEWRAHLPKQKSFQQDHPSIFQKPAFSGEDLTHKTLLLYTEQGFGDNLQYARFIAHARTRASRVVMWCRKGLGRLFQHCYPLDEITEDSGTLPEFDCHASLMSLPFFFDRELASLRNFSPYIFPAPNQPELFHKIPGKLNVGLVWGAEQLGYEHSNKKVPLEMLAPLFSIPGIAWVSLQVGKDSEDLKSFSEAKKIIDLGSKLKDFADTASVVDELDLVISCDTSVAHLAGGMGKPLWVMLHGNPDWRWHSDNDHCPWYPSSRLYRQKALGSWDYVIRRLCEDLLYQVSKVHDV